jgi:hypothetical protein
MKTNETLKMKGDEAGFLTTLGVLEFLVAPSLPLGKYGGGIAMLAVAAIGLPAYFILFRERLRSRGQLKAAAVIAVVGIAAGSVVAFGLSMLVRGHWH